MSEIKWNADQLKAIEARDQKVLVSAAAGSGKTAVLTKRITDMLISEEKPVSADRLLVVTFTKAAAKQMRERIEKSLKDELKNALAEKDLKKEKRIRKQIKLLDRAKISTIDSYCQQTVKEYFHLVGISPTFGILSKSEEDLLMKEVYSSLENKLYEEKDEDFIYLAENMTKAAKEDSLFDYVAKIYRFIQNFQYPEEYLRACKNEYKLENGFFDSIWGDRIYEKISEALDTLFLAYDIILEAAIDEKKGKIQKEKETLENLLKVPLSKMQKAIKDIDTKDFGIDVEDTLDEMLALFPENVDKCENIMKNILAPQVMALLELTEKFFFMMEEKKKSISLHSFSDIERFMYQLLDKNKMAREELVGRFDEILIDEYQDTNALQDGIFEMLTNGKNMFMVGDMKQSIYRFRGSEPLVFRNKQDAYKTRKNNINRKIYLKQNFRSRREVLNAVNDLFERCMTKAIGEINYDSSQMLNLGNTIFGRKNKDYIAEFKLLGLPDGENAPDRAHAEAKYVADRINKMKKEGFLIHDTKEITENGVLVKKDILRPIKNSDILILMSSHKKDGDVFKSVLEKAGIGAHVEREGFFSKAEIKLMMSVLKAIDNPKRDISFVAVLRSPIGGFSDDEIARIRAFERNGCFYDALLNVYSKYLLLKEREENIGAAKIFGEKIGEFLSKLNSWRERARYLTSSKFIDMLLEETGIKSFAKALYGDEAEGNLRLFFDRSKEYDALGYRGVFALLKHLEELEDSDEDLQGASTKATDDSVRIMTIHKSKGLEEGVVFLCGMNKRFNLKDASDSLMLHNKLGVTMDFTSYEKNVSVMSPLRQVFSKTIKDELLSEEMRKLYVALTRAKEKVIAVGSVKKGRSEDSLTKKWEDTLESGITPYVPFAISFADWLGPVAKTSDLWDFEYIEAEPMVKHSLVSLNNKTDDLGFLPDKNTLKSIISWEYPYASSRIKSKAAVSDFKGIHMANMTQKPRFLTEDKFSGTDVGDTVHKIMEIVDMDKGTNSEYLERLFDALSKSGAVKKEALSVINKEKIIKFFKSDIGRRMANSKDVMRESEFEISILAKRLYPDIDDETEKVLLQGIIDCWFIEDGEIVLVDYKTDRVSNISEIHEKYDIQLELYAEALEKIAKKRVKEKVIYLFSEDSVVKC